MRAPRSMRVACASHARRIRGLGGPALTVERALQQGGGLARRPEMAACHIHDGATAEARAGGLRHMPCKTPSGQRANRLHDLHLDALTRPGRSAYTSTAGPHGRAGSYGAASSTPWPRALLVQSVPVSRRARQFASSCNAGGLLDSGRVGWTPGRLALLYTGAYSHMGLVSRRHASCEVCRVGTAAVR